MSEDRIDRVLESVDPSKRDFLKRLVVGTAFVVPQIASFSMDGLSVYDAHAQGGSNIAPSDRGLKERFAPVDSQAILARVCRLAVETWNYRGQDPAVRHMGPMAQDFAAAFGVGADDRRIDLVDANGVALAAIQGLAERLRAQEAEIRALRAELRRLATAVQEPRAPAVA
jgi:hypothetical protein